MPRYVPLPGKRKLSDVQVARKALDKINGEMVALRRKQAEAELAVKKAMVSEAIAEKNEASAKLEKASARVEVTEAELARLVDETEQSLPVNKIPVIQLDQLGVSSTTTSTTTSVGSDA